MAIKIQGTTVIDDSKNASLGAATFTGAVTGTTFTGALSGNASTATLASDSNKLIGKTWSWSGQAGQPTWVWGGSDGTNMYVWNPANFSVANATTWGGANKYVSTSAPSGGVSGDIWLQYS